MRPVCKYLMMLAVCGFSFLSSQCQCPPRPEPNTVLNDAPSLYSENGTLTAGITLGYSVDSAGYTHYCYQYITPTGIVEAPTLRLNPGDQLSLSITDAIPSTATESKSAMHAMSPTSATTCGSGFASLQATNVHFHGLSIPPICHQDDVLDTLIQPGANNTFQYNTTIPLTQPPGLYWYHPHVHGFTEFQVNGGAAGALIVEGMEKYRPEVTGLVERVFTIRQEYLVPWIPGPYQLTINFENAAAFEGPTPYIQMNAGEKQFWRVANATIQDFMPLQLLFNGVPQQLELIALDGYPLAAPRYETTILIPPAGRAEFIVQAPSAPVDAVLEALAYNTGPTGNADVQQPIATIQIANPGGAKQAAHQPQPRPQLKPATPASPAPLKFASLKDATPTTQRSLYFSEEFAGTNGPIQFYITVGGQPQRVFNANEKPAITTKVGAVEDWTIENHALETHDFHIHQIHFMVLEVNGQPVADQDMRDTIQIPYWSGKGPYPSVKLRMDFRDPTIAGTFVFHCHILLHEDLGMMHKILVEP